MIKFERVGIAADHSLRNLYQLYIHDMSEWLPFEVGGEGRFAFDTAPLWTGDVAVYLAHFGGALAGFAVVTSASPWVGREAARDIKDFFVVRRHRREGVGRALAQHLWREYPGEWLVRVLAANRPAVPFWRTAVRDFLGEAFQESSVSSGSREWVHLRFDTTRGAGAAAQDV